MKQRILKAISIVLAILAFLFAVCAVTVTGSGVLDLSNIVRAVCAGAAVVCGILAAVAWQNARP